MLRLKTKDFRQWAEGWKWQEITQLIELSYYIRFTKELEYLDTKTYEGLWAKAQEGLRTLQELISYIEKSGV